MHEDYWRERNELIRSPDLVQMRDLFRELTRIYGGKIRETSDGGLMLNMRFEGHRAQFHANPFYMAMGVGHATIAVIGLHTRSGAILRAKDSRLCFCARIPRDRSRNHHLLAGATGGAGIGVQLSCGTGKVDENAARAFCDSLQGHLASLSLAETEELSLARSEAIFVWKGTDITVVLPRLKLFDELLRSIARPPQPERRLFEREWLVEPAVKVEQGTAAHVLGGTQSPAVACTVCGGATNRMARIDLGDPALPETPWGRGLLPVFWCLACAEWDPAFYDMSSPVPQPLSKETKNSAAKKLEPGEDDLSEKKMTLMPVAVGKKAGRKNRIGGSPSWIQNDDTPDCPRCKKSMAFVLQLASDSRISYADMGMIYCFARPECRVAASLVQSH